jgi:hypothetical protein
MLPADPLRNVVEEGIKRSIRVALAEKCYGAAVILIYAGIDAMAFLGMPSSHEDVTRDDFIAWVDRFIYFPCKEQVSGLEFYGARCGMLHNYSAFSRLSREGKCRIIGYVDESVPEVMTAAEVPHLVLVSIVALAQAFSVGVDAFLNEISKDTARAGVAAARLNKLVQSTDVPPHLRT